MNTSTQHAVYFIAEIVLKSMAVVRFKLYRGLTAKCSVIGNKNIPPTVMHHIMNTEVKKYRPKSPKTILLGLISLLFTVGGTFIVQEEPIKGWLITTFFGLCLLVFVIQLIPGSTELKLTNEGFEMTSLFRRSLTSWQDVKTFKIGYLGPNKTIMFDYVEGHNKHQTGKLIAKELSGSHGALPSTYGLKAADLLEIMNEWKNKYGA